MSYSTKVLTIFGVLPLVLKSFTPGDIVLWYLFSTIITLQSIVDFGFRQTFSRLISYAYGGANELESFVSGNRSGLTTDMPNLSLLEIIVSTMTFIYKRLTILLFIFMIFFGTWMLLKPIGDSSNLHGSWTSWAIVLIISCISFYSKIYLNFLEGLNRIALVRRVEALTSIGSIISSIAVLILSPSLLHLVMVNQFWVLIVCFRDWYLCFRVEDNIFRKLQHDLPFNKDVFYQIWEPAWRSGISGIMSNGLTNLTGFVYAQFANSIDIASYLLAIRIINQIKDVSMAPFYSKLPYFAILRIKNRTSELIEAAKRGMMLSHVTFVFLFIVIGCFSDFFLEAINSEVPFVSQGMWILLGIAFFIHRYGAMHIQIYLSTNHIISHIADGISGLIYLFSCILLFNYIGIYSVPISMILGYFGFYSWYAAMYSYRSLNISFWKFELQTSFFPLLFIVIYSVVMYIFI